MRLKDAFSYIDLWKGIAIIWIIIFHTNIDFHGSLNIVKEFGYGGCDIFLFASGIGNYKSYLRDELPVAFLKRRIDKLAPLYVPFIIIWITYRLNKGDFSIQSIFGNLIGVQGFSSSGTNFNWYITAIILCYILTPYLASFTKQSILFNNVGLLLVLVTMTSCFYNDYNRIIVISRLPIFYLGMIFAKYDETSVNAIKWPIVSLGILAAGWLLKITRMNQPGYIWNNGLYWYPFIIIAPALCIIISIFGKKGDEYWVTKIVLDLIKKLGQKSFEIFLIHCLIFEIIKSRYKESLSNYRWFIIIFLSIIISIAYGYLARKSFSIIKKR